VTAPVPESPTGQRIIAALLAVLVALMVNLTASIDGLKTEVSELRADRAALGVEVAEVKRRVEKLENKHE